ncbi:uncharacterized protein [Branchiostoma lanceolatum]|uniref:uncharacterized protein n=1 Tax=Branchiostoma lanceolatum TaxID=7740 RepID=UPI0034568132
MPRRLRLTLYPRKTCKSKSGAQKANAQHTNDATCDDGWVTEEEDAFPVLESTEKSPYSPCRKRSRKSLYSTPRRKAKRSIQSPITPVSQKSRVRKKIRFGTPVKSDDVGVDLFEFDEVSRTKEKETQTSAGDVRDGMDADSTALVDEVLNEMIDLLPKVILELKHADSSKKDILLRFCRLVEEGEFPLDNISFHLWCEVVQWYGLDTSSEMRYSPVTKSFWKLGWRLFGGRFLRLMSGSRGIGQVVSGEASIGLCHTKSSTINFAVPSVAMLSNFQPYGNFPNTISPGFIEQMVVLANETLKGKSCCLAFDGKKIAPGLTQNSGDIDLLGHEQLPEKSLKERKSALNEDIQKVQSLMDLVCTIQSQSGITSSDQLDDHSKRALFDELYSLFQLLSMKSAELRHLKKKKEFALKSFKARGGSDWRKSKYIYVISALHTMLNQVQECTFTWTTVREKLCHWLAILNNAGTTFMPGTVVRLTEQTNYISLQNIEELHDRHGEPLVESLQDGDIQTKVDTREIPQGTPEWHTIRSSARVTGSQLHRALGLESLKAQKEYFDRAIKKVINPPSFSEEQERAMAHGIEHEVDAAATLASKVLPALEPNLQVYEEGCIIMKQDNKPFLVVSPDRSLRSSRNCTVSAVEIKCPYTADVHDKIPFRYLSQLHAEMAALQCPVLLYLSYKADCTNVFKVTADTGLWADIWSAAVSQYGGSKPVKPTHLTPESKSLKQMLKEKAETVEFLGEFPSVTAVREPHLSSTVTSGSVRVNTLALEELSTLLMSVERLINEHYQLNRKKASEVVVQIVGNLDREWSMEQTHGFPTNYFLKGYSLTSEVMRSIVEENHQKCHDIGIHIPCRSFDGQWRQLLVRDKNGNPLTLLQLQKDIWKEVCGQKKRAIVEDLKTIPALEWVVEKDGQTGKSVIRVRMQNNLPFPTTAAVGWKTQDTSTSQESSVRADTTDDDTSLLPMLDTLPLESGSPSDNAAGNRDAAFSALDEISRELQNNDADADNVGHVHSQQPDTNNEEEIEQTDTDESVYAEPDQPQTEELDCEQTHMADQQNHQLSESEFREILEQLIQDEKANVDQRWNNQNLEDFKEKFTSAAVLDSSFRNVDLNCIVECLKSDVKECEAIMRSWPKYRKVNALSDILADGSHVEVKKRRTRVTMPLSVLCEKVLLSNQYPKQALNVTLSEYKYAVKQKEWEETSAISNDVKVEGTNDPAAWFYKPEFSSERSQLEVSCIDGDHLLTRWRAHCARGNVKRIKRDAWIQVAKDRTTNLNISMVEDMLDAQSVPIACTFFSRQVEEKMVHMGFDREACFVRHIREGLIVAHDDSGISSSDRVKMRFRLRTYLMVGVNFHRFPPPGRYISSLGCPWQLWEDTIASIDAHMLLYPLVQQGSYNQRAFSSLLCEQFFSEMTGDDKTGHQGTLTAGELTRHFGATCEVLATRLNPHRKWDMRTKKSSVYPVVTAEPRHACSSMKKDTCLSLDKKHILQIRPRNHVFDLIRRRKSQRKSGHISGPNEPARGARGVRQHHRIDESKLLPSTRAGIGL